MELMERYLAAIRRNLPNAARGPGADDIVAELRDDLFSRKEDREEALGRALNTAETNALLKDFGHPWVVAARFRTHQYLIGPAVFPFYLAVMRIVLMIVVAIVLVVSVGKAMFGGGDLIQTWAQSMSGIFSAVLFNAAIVTLIFAILERTGFAAEHKRNWKPDQLPDILDKQKGAWEAAIEVALGIAFLLWWTGNIHLPWTTGSPEFRVEPAPIFTELYWPILILVAARLVHNLVEWLRPRWKLVRGLLGIGTALGGLALIFLIYQAGHWATVISTGMAPELALKLQESLNLSLRIALVVVAAIWTFQCLGELWRLIRGRADRRA